MSESGSYYDYGSGSGINDDVVNKYKLIQILLPLSPILFFGTAALLCFIKICIIERCILNNYHKLKKKYNSYLEENKHPPLIKNNKLSNSFIKQCNKTNMNTDKKSLECSICLEYINIEDYKKKPNDLIFLNCSHVFHTDCIQSWTSSQVEVGREVNCPLCRDHILIDIPKTIERTISEISFGSEWN